jgi:bifunctional NMN adenylyltransferase/nudix hydrolase
MKPSYGVIVGRFQVNALHDGHKDLFDQVLARHKRVIVFVGVQPAGMTKDSPLDFATREAMIKADYPTFMVQPLEDCKDDQVWSDKLDAKIGEVCNYADVTLYGGRDSFVPHYHGNHKPVELALDPRKHKISGTEIRNAISNEVLGSPDFRAGIIYAMSQLWPVLWPCVDIAILNSDKTEVLLGRKPGEKQFRFIGGHGLSLIDRAIDHSGDYTTMVGSDDAYGNELDEVFLDGDLKREQAYENVWETARKYDRYVEEAQEAFA